MTGSAAHLALDEKGWLRSFPGVRLRASPHADARPEGEAGRVTLAVMHFISLPAGRFGGDAPDRLFMGELDPLAPGWPADPDWEPLKSLRGLRVSTHFFVRRTGEIIQYVPTFRRAWHAGLSNFRGRNACNDFSVGIELEGTGEVPFEDAQYAALAPLFRAIAERHPLRFVTGHECIAPGRKTDPGPCFDWERLRAQLPEGVALAIAASDCDREALAERIAALSAMAEPPKPAQRS